MTDLVESSTWTPGIRQFETSDPVEGGPDGIDNVPLRQLANRTRFLKDRQEAHEGAVDPYPQYATKADLAQKVAALVDQSPEALNTLRELANALGNDPSFATTMTNALAQKAPIESPVFTGAAKGATPGQFDASTRLATTAFVQRYAVQFNGSVTVSANTTLDVTYVGKLLVVYGAAAATTQTLPALANMAEGATITVVNLSSYAVTLQRAGSSETFAVSGTSTMTLQPGDTITLVAKPSGNLWVQYSGSAQLQTAGSLSSWLAPNGYQKLPSGLIIQWGFAQTSNSGAPYSTTVTLPLAFPTNFFGALTTNVGGGTDYIGCNTGQQGATSQILFNSRNTGGQFFIWFAWGR
ncbi:gp53-like domain-containing protein [Burkholderia ubonensis]|uniref:gp53-like domain-containing protein n=1 Tax=Burkholderia ubonensis TaxID=101571 RepID=UPI0008414720|nr:hypothetical protein [Burkholderia ubonensis]